MASLVQPTGPAHTRILSIGAARGDLDVPNDDIIGPIDSSDEWIRQRTGIVQRRRASAEVLAVDLAVAAGEEAIERSGLDRADIDGVIISTISNVAVTPSMASLAAHRLGLTPPPSFVFYQSHGQICQTLKLALQLRRNGARLRVEHADRAQSQAVSCHDRRPCIEPEVAVYNQRQFGEPWILRGVTDCEHMV